MLKRAKSLLDYASQVRLFGLLLLLLLVALLLGITYLFSQTKLRLEQGQEEKLELVAKLAFKEISSDPEWREGSLSQEVVSRLLALKNEVRAHRLILWDRRGGELVLGPSESLRPPSSSIEAAWAGRTTLSNFYRDKAGGYYQALLLPLKGERGEMAGLLVVEGRADFLGWLSQLRWALVLGYGCSLLLALLLSFLFIRSILRPYARLSSAALDFTKLSPALSRVEGEDPPPQEGGDMEFVAQTFQKMIDALKEQQAELSRLYAAEQKRARDLQAYQEYILGSISSGVISLRPDLTIVVFNRTAQQIFGLEESEVLGRSCREVFGEEGEITRLAEEAIGLKRIHSRLELSIKRRDEGPIWIGLSSSLLRDGEGNIVGLTFLLTDLTEILMLREQVMLKESLATLGQMSAGIAHEFRNSLGAILGFAKLLQKKLPLEDPRSAHVQDIIAECGNLEAVLKDFLAFAKPEKLQLSQVDLNALIMDSLEAYRQRLEGAGVKIRLSLPPEGLFVQADLAALKRALVNLIRNAAEAMPEGGELVIEAGVRGHRRETPAAGRQPPGQGLQTSDAQDLGSGVWGPESGPGRWVEIVVVDTGCGIPEEDRERIFTPFFTTKEGGTGLGLALVQKAVVGHGGRVEVESRLGKGSTFKILLPYGERRRSPRL